MLSFFRTAVSCLVGVCLLPMCSCTGAFLYGSLSYLKQTSDPLATYTLTGDTLAVLDPSIIRQGSTYYAFSTDVSGSAANGSLAIRCSNDKLSWAICSAVFPQTMPGWVKENVPGAVGLWAPDVSFFNGEYHVYYAGSVIGSQRSVIGLATNNTLDPTDPAYKWVDRGLVLQSNPGDDFNAIDPAIFVDSDGGVFLNYGSYWTGIKQQQIDPITGMLLPTDTTRYDLATRPGVPHDPIEGASIVRHGNFYYLFVSVDYCCEQNVAENNYKQAVGRSTSPHGPFLDELGTAMTNGGGTVLLQGNGTWNAPGGGTAYVDSNSGESLIVFHAHDVTRKNAPFQWVKRLDWVNDWPVIGE